MADATLLLFEEPFNGSPLFKNQLDLINRLLETPYYKVYDDNPQLHNKALNRLKAYISQLLSGTANRTITKDFRDSLSQLIESRLPNKVERDKLLQEIFESMTSKRTLGNSKDKRLSSGESFQVAFSSASYISIITASPVRARFSEGEDNISIIEFFLSDLMEHVLNHQDISKTYRFNFPMKTDCEVFWLGVESGLSKKFEDILDTEGVADELYDDRFLLKTETHHMVQQYKKLSLVLTKEQLKDPKDKLISKCVSNLIELLNRNKIIVAYHTEEPIYSVPTIAIDPNDPTVSKLFILAEDDHREMHLINSSRENMLLWRRFVWNKIITSKTTKQISSPYLQFETKS